MASMKQGKAGIGIIGCGNISEIYFQNLTQKFHQAEIIACSDLNEQRALEKRERYGTPVMTTDELLKNKEVDIILNLTTPPFHAAINLQVLEKGKHVYCEKPFALNRQDARQVLRRAEENSLFIGCAPDTFLGAGLQRCRQLIDSGAIGTPHSAYAFMLCPGHESWHPSPDFYYQPGGGPMLDMGPYYFTALVSLLGPIKEIYGKTGKAFNQRECTAEGTLGQRIEVNTWTDYKGLVEFSSGVTAMIATSFDVFHSELPRIEIHGTQGSLMVPDPNTFEGPVRLFQNGFDQPRDISLDGVPYQENSRGIGLADMALGIREQRAPRASGELAYHVLDSMLAMEDSMAQGGPVHVESSVEQPKALKEGIKEGEL